jgi:hypothetical protein
VAGKTNCSERTWQQTAVWHPRVPSQRSRYPRRNFDGNLIENKQQEADEEKLYEAD